MEQEQLAKTLEALLFVAAKPFKAKELAKILELDVKEIETALGALCELRKESGIVVLNNNGEYQLSTNSAYSTQVKNFLNAELREKLTDATVEVLAIIAYRQPISKAEIEAIRGVNSQYSLRNLLMRGLIEKVSNPHDARSFLYQTTTEFLMHLGLTNVSELPEFEKLVAQIKLPDTPAITNSAQPDKTTRPSMPPDIQEEQEITQPEPIIETQETTILGTPTETIIVAENTEPTTETEEDDELDDEDEDDEDK
ncbi:MAG: SMC-Scp complex subunit ScpB [Candidatus Doudnabacteria bacterium]|jgi:segregation and condensation protein B